LCIERLYIDGLTPYVIMGDNQQCGAGKGSRVGRIKAQRPKD